MYLYAKLSYKKTIRVTVASQKISSKVLSRFHILMILRRLNNRTYRILKDGRNPHRKLARNGANEIITTFSNTSHHTNMCELLSRQEVSYYT
jgi:hypothetical protein